MIPSVFLDTNILVDHLAERKPFSVAAAKIIALAEKGFIKAYISLLSVHIVFYLLRKLQGDNRKTKTAILALCKICRVVTTNDPLVVESALKSDFSDVEDALQFFTAKAETTIHILITRDGKGFKQADLLVMSPAEFLASLEF